MDKRGYPHPAIVIGHDFRVDLVHINRLDYVVTVLFSLRAPNCDCRR